MSFKDNAETVNNSVKLLRSIHVSLFVIPLFLFITVYLIEENFEFDEITLNLTTTIVISISIALLGIGNFLLKKSKYRALETTNFKSKITLHQMGVLAFFSCIEFTIMINMMLILSTNNSVYLYTTLLVIGYLILMRPNKEKIKSALKLF